MGRLFGFLGVVIVLAIGMYVYSKQVQSSSAPAGANTPKAAINITGVRSDLIGIATAERRYFASEGKYASLDELTRLANAALENAGGLIEDARILLTAKRWPRAFAVLLAVIDVVFLVGYAALETVLSRGPHPYK